jgi:hypothetical protein
VEVKTKATTSRWRSTGISDGKRTMDDAFVSQHVLEEKGDSSETNLQSKTSTNGKDVS